MVELPPEIKKLLGVQTEYEFVLYCMDLGLSVEERYRLKHKRRVMTGDDVIADVSSVLRERITLSTYNLNTLKLDDQVLVLSNAR